MATLARRPPEPLRRAAGALLEPRGRARADPRRLARRPRDPDRPLPDGRQPAQPGPADDRGRPGRAADDLHHHHRRHRPLGRLDHGAVRDPARRVLAEPRPAAPARDGARDPASAARRRLQRLVHHPGRRAAADHDARDAGALSRPRRGHQPGALGARLSGLVLRARPGRGAGRADPALAPARGHRVLDRCSRAPPSAARSTRSATTRRPRASPASRSTASSSSSTRSRA